MAFNRYLPEHHKKCLCGAPTRVLRALCKLCHSYVRMRIKQKEFHAERKERLQQLPRKFEYCLCGEPVDSSRGLCSRCYTWVERWAERKKEIADIIKCICGRPPKTRGLCGRCYQILWVKAEKEKRNEETPDDPYTSKPVSSL